MAWIFRKWQITFFRTFILKTMRVKTGIRGKCLHLNIPKMLINNLHKETISFVSSSFYPVYRCLKSSNWFVSVVLPHLEQINNSKTTQITKGCLFIHRLFVLPHKKGTPVLALTSDASTAMFSVINPFDLLLTRYSTPEPLCSVRAEMVVGRSGEALAERAELGVSVSTSSACCEVSERRG